MCASEPPRSRSGCVCKAMQPVAALGTRSRSAADPLWPSTSATFAYDIASKREKGSIRRSHLKGEHLCRQMQSPLGLKKPVPPKRLGENGAPTSANASGARLEKTTVPMATPGIISVMTKHALAPTTGEKTAL